MSEPLAEGQGSALWDATLAYFTDEGWPVRADPATGVLETAFKGAQGKWSCLARVLGDTDRLLFYSFGPMDAAEDMVQPLSELLTRVNHGLIIGNFELNFDDGSFRYKTSLDASEITPSHALLHGLVLANVLTMDRYLPAVQRLLYAAAPVQRALAEVEG